MCITEQKVSQIMEKHIGKHHEDLAEKIVHAFNSVVSEIIKHDKPSKATAGFMEESKVDRAIMQKDMERLEEKMDRNLDYSKKAITKIESVEEKNHQDHENMRKEADQKYASKEMEKWIKTAVGLVMTAVIMALIALVLK